MDNTIYDDDEILDYEFQEDIDEDVATTLAESASAAVRSCITFDTSKLFSAIQSIVSESVIRAIQSMRESIMRVMEAIDYSAITSALSGITESVSSTIAVISERVRSANESTFAAIHSFYAWLIASLHDFINNRKRSHYSVIPYDVSDAIVLYSIPCVKTFKIKFLQFAPRLRAVFLLRCRERGTTSDDENAVVYVAS